MSDELIRLQQQFAIYRSEYAILLAGAKECEARAEAAERRVAELEAQLAAQAWRPVTEPPTEAGDYLVWVKYDGEPGFCAVCGWDRVLQWDDNFVHPKYWHPLPSLNL